MNGGTIVHVNTQNKSKQCILYVEIIVDVNTTMTSDLNSDINVDLNAHLKGNLDAY